ncbi:hypothetical protein QAD02_019676 [Eretmocerus hayati]|uniref:Uncharacterized protein n=1 Tax=Eretmocerus hayati TaxID=131215 RepID=A0ACC2PMT0_9HYME|nr:hypothetical protein QAD02_019676 [Eretmocerus hayati]
MHLYRVSGFIRRHWWGGKKLDFAQWTLFTPRDTPTQYRGEGKSRLLTMNCCPHVMTWSSIICSGQAQEFNDMAMDSIRRRIAEILVNHAGFQDKYYTRGHGKRRLQGRGGYGKSSVKKVSMIKTSTLPIHNCQSTQQLCASLHEL